MVYINWNFITVWNLDGNKLDRTVRIRARDQLAAYREYCSLDWVQDIDYEQFESLTITIG